MILEHSSLKLLMPNPGFLSWLHNHFLIPTIFLPDFQVAPLTSLSRWPARVFSSSFIISLLSFCPFKSASSVKTWNWMFPQIAPKIAPGMPLADWVTEHTDLPSKKRNWVNNLASYYAFSYFTFPLSPPDLVQSPSWLPGSLLLTVCMLALCKDLCRRVTPTPVLNHLLPQTNHT